MGQTDEGHIRDALSELTGAVDTLARVMEKLLPLDGAFDRNNPANVYESLMKVDDHVRAIRVRGDSKRKAQADGTPE